MANKEDQANSRLRRKAKGLTRIEFWLKPAWIAKVKELIAQLEHDDK